jgi:hypothetical protein
MRLAQFRDADARLVYVNPVAVASIVDAYQGPNVLINLIGGAMVFLADTTAGDVMAKLSLTPPKACECSDG